VLQEEKEMMGGSKDVIFPRTLEKTQAKSS